MLSSGPEATVWLSELMAAIESAGDSNGARSCSESETASITPDGMAWMSFPRSSNQCERLFQREDASQTCGNIFANTVSDHSGGRDAALQP